MRDAGGNLTITHLLQAYCVLQLHASPHPPQCAHWGTFPPGEGLRLRRYICPITSVFTTTGSAGPTGAPTSK